MGSKTPAILVLCDDYDASALWAANCLAERGRAVSVVTASHLDAARRWDHRIERSGTTSVSIDLADGRRLSDSDGAAVLNRLTFLSSNRINAVAGEDRDYAVQEMNALVLSCLYALPGPMLNRPTTQGLGGNWRHPSAWAVLAGRAGLAAPPYRQSCGTDPNEAWQPRPAPATVTVFAVAGHLVASPAMPQATWESCLRLARLAGDALLGIELIERGGCWEFQAASPRPDLVLGGEPLIDLLDEALST